MKVTQLELILTYSHRKYATSLVELFPIFYYMSDETTRIKKKFCQGQFFVFSRIKISVQFQSSNYTFIACKWL